MKLFRDPQEREVIEVSEYYESDCKEEVMMVVEDL